MRLDIGLEPDQNDLEYPTEMFELSSVNSGKPSKVLHQASNMIRAMIWSGNCWHCGEWNQAGRTQIQGKQLDLGLPALN